MPAESIQGTPRAAEVAARAPVRRGEPDGVAADQRGRLMDAMIEAVDRHGYPAITVGELAKLASVSKSTFYEHFASKEDCFLATFDALMDRTIARVREVDVSDGDLDRIFRRGVKPFANLLTAEPKAASFVIVDSLSLGIRGAERRERVAARFESMLRRAVRTRGGEINSVLLRGIIGGLRRVAYRALRDDRPELLAEHGDELADWALGYVSRGSTLPSAFYRSQLRGSRGDSRTAESAADWNEPPDSPRSRAVLSQRERILRAVARVVSDKGYADLTIPAISAAAGVSNQTFYQEFNGKQEAFLESFDRVVERAYERTAPAFREGGDWLEAVGRATCTLLAFIAADPTFARLVFFEISAAGGAGRDHLERAAELFGSLLRPSRGPTPPKSPPAVVLDAIAGGVWMIIQREISQGRVERLPSLAPDLVDFTVLPFVD
jgi:AcrR family transcriptional regulator